MRLDLKIVKHQIDTLLVMCPELAEDEILLADMIEGETDAHEFLRSIETKRREAVTMAGALAININGLNERRERFSRREQAMRNLAFKVMEVANIRKIEMPEATYSLRNGTPKVIITDETLLPDVLCRINREPDKTKIKELLTNGSPVRGAELSNSEPSLAIRTK